MTDARPSTVLAPSFRLPLALLLLAVPPAGAAALLSGGGSALSLTLALLLLLLGLTLAIQTALIRLDFQGEALVVTRQDTVLRRFPYDSWLGWRVFWPGLPVLFYFREVRSIHLLPVLFDAGGLRDQLERHVPVTDPAGGTS
jgi:hypothetical protein